jgi:hypothetical protein
VVRLPLDLAVEEVDAALPGLQKFVGVQSRLYLSIYFCYADLCKQSIGVHMESNPTPATTNYQQVTVDVPEDRIAEFHAFFGRFLAGRPGRGRRRRYGRPHRGVHGGGCAQRGEAAERGEATEQSAGTTEV